MNIYEAQNISIVGYLASLGIEPESYSNGQAWYCSPLRPGEKKPSFKVNTRINKWKDFGSEGKGGDLIDLICRMNSVSATGALLLLESPGIRKEYLSFRGKPINNNFQDTRLILQHVQPLQNWNLLQYAENRGIKKDLVCRYCYEVHYNRLNPETGEQKKYFSLGFKNDRDGWELRNQYFKNCISPKTITTIPGKLSKMLSIFEGFFDFLSACQFFNVQKPAGTVIILNSTIHVQKVLPLLQNYDKISLYLDNDTTGQLAAKKIREAHSRITNYSQIIYPEHKDFNEFLTNRETGTNNH